jgi:capsular polysaccharide biosynthesis protein
LVELSEFGIKEIFLEDLNTSQQAIIFNNAKLIIGFHGSGFASLFFGKPETTIVEIFSPDFLRTDFWDEASILSLRYFAYCEDMYKKTYLIFG